MDRHITRRYGLSPNEVRAAVIAYLKTINVPYPDDDDFELKIIDGGLVLHWSEDIAT